MGKINIILASLILLANVAFADVRIYCPNCKTHLYDYVGSEEPLRTGINLSASDFHSVIDGVIDPVDGDDTICPLCKSPLNGYEYWFWSKKREVPRMAYSVLTFYIEDRVGNLKWYPFDLLLDEDIRGY